MYLCLFTRSRVCICLCLPARVCVSVSVYARACVFLTLFTRACVCIFLCLRARVCVSVSVYARACGFLTLFTRARVCGHTHVLVRDASVLSVLFSCSFCVCVHVFRRVTKPCSYHLTNKHKHFQRVNSRVMFYILH